MNKEFRVWDSILKNFEDTSQNWCNDVIEICAPPRALLDQAVLYLYEDCEKRYFIQQWTNALDKNNKKIFEGDIVLWSNPDPYDSEELVTRVVGYNRRTMGFRLYKFPEQVGKEAGSSFFPEEVEVIGNIFEGAVKDGVDYGLYLKAKCY